MLTCVEMDVVSPDPDNHRVNHDDQTALQTTPATTATPQTEPATAVALVKSPAEQGSFLRASILQRLQVDETVYLVPAKWYNRFNLWTRGTGPAPGTVDPSVLVDEEGVLLDDVIEERDWISVNQAAWEMIKQ